MADEFVMQDKRQLSRAERMKTGYNSGSFYNWTGKLRFGFGMGLYFLCIFIFFVRNTSVEPDSSDMMAMSIISLMLCAVAAVLIFFSSRRYRYVTYPLAILILAGGWFIPRLNGMIAASEQAQTPESPTGPTTAAQTEEESTAEEDGRALQKSDLDVFYQQKNAQPQGVHYAVYMSHQDTRTRSIVREAMSRLLGADDTRAYTRNDGALFVVSLSRGRLKNISKTLSRFGHITYSAPSEGIYEVRFSPDKVNMVSRYPMEVLAEPSHPAYVTANIEELKSFDPMRIRSAAKNLHQSNVQMLRNEIRETLLEVMQDPWTSDFDTYSVLASAATTFARPSGDKDVIEACRKFFRLGLSMKREMPDSVTNYLVKEVPEEMVEPIVAFWCENPIAWARPMAQLGGRTQEPLLEKLRSSNNIRLTGTIIRYLKDYGSAEALEDIKPFLSHQDSIIRHTAQDAINAIESRR